MPTAATASNARSTIRGGRRPGSYIPFIFFAFFGVIISVNAVMVYFALTSWTGISTKDHYRKGLAYNLNLAGARAQEERGWQVGFDAAAAPARRTTLVFTLRDRDGAPLTGAKVTAALIRPTSEGHDFTAGLAEQGPGRYGAEVEAPLPGVWDVQVIAEHPAGDYQLQRRILVKD